MRIEDIGLAALLGLWLCCGCGDAAQDSAEPVVRADSDIDSAADSPLRSDSHGDSDPTDEADTDEADTDGGFEAGPGPEHVPVTGADQLDVDGDGYTPAAGDCRDHDPEVHPGALERCDSGVDEDCDGLQLSCGLLGTVTTAETDGVVTGPGYDVYASAVITTGDLDADGYDDLVIGSPGADRDNIAAYVFRGPIYGHVDCSFADASLVEVDGYSGGALALGDFDGSGLQGVAVDATDGVVLLVLPPITGSIDLSTADAVVTVAEDDHGSALVAADLDLDGVDDLVIGADDDEQGGSGAGAVAVFEGPVVGSLDSSAAQAWLVGEEGSYLGEAIAAGDLNGDGVGDVFLGSKFLDVEGEAKAGGAYVLLGPHSGTMDVADADLRVAGEQASDYLGYSVLVAEFDGDGLEDVVVASPGYEDEGAVWVYLGRSDDAWASAEPVATVLGGELARPGYSLATGDLTADGHQDLLVEAYAGYCSHSFYCYDYRAYLLTGPFSGTTTLADAAAEISDGYNAGMSLGAGDLNGDGVSDAAVSWWWRSETYHGEWTAWLFYGG